MIEDRNNLFIDYFFKHSRFSILFIYNVVTVIVLFAFYPIVPVLLGYPPDAIAVSRLYGASINMQYSIGVLLTLTISTVILARILRGIDLWPILNEENEVDRTRLRRIREKCIDLPNFIFIGQIVFITAPVAVLLISTVLFTGAPITVALRITILFFSLFSVVAVFSHTFSRKIFNKVLLKTYNGEGLQGRRIGLYKKIFIQILPMLVVAILFTAVLGYSRLMEEKGDIIYKLCVSQLNEKFKTVEKVRDENQIFEMLEGIKLEDAKVSYFVVTPDGNIITSDNSVPSVYLKHYIKNPVNGSRVYSDTNEIQGAVIKVNSASGAYSAGIKFEMASDRTVNYFLFTFAALLLLNVFALYYFSKTLSNDISMVATSLMEIAAKSDVDLDKKIPVTSNDEIGDLVVAFNKVQEKEKEHIREIEEKHEIMMEQERMASLGQLMGGIAHNLRSPIMSLSGAMEGMKDLINEYRSSINDPEVTVEDHQEIAGEMLEWIEKMKPYCTYMSDIITAIRDQTLQPSSDSYVSFTLDDLSKRVDILMSHELKRYHCKLKTNFKANMNIQIKGELSAMVQILNNLILNAIDAYEGRGGEIELNVEVKDNKVIIMVKDYAKGISDEVKERVFKEMITTKGKSGTGLGLYMSNSNLKARFGGRMWFKSEEGKGTEFYISVPIKEY